MEGKLPSLNVIFGQLMKQIFGTVGLILHVHPHRAVEQLTISQDWPHTSYLVLY